MRSRVLPAAVVVMVLSSLAFSAGHTSSGPDWRAVLVDSVSGANILQTVVELEAFGTRDFHTDQAMDAALLIQQWMQEIGLETDLQEFTADGVLCANVIGTLNPENNDSGIILFGGHYDSRNRYAVTVSEAKNISAPGADDNGSGVGAMLEIARLLAGCEAYDAATRFVAFGAEERGFDNKSGLAGSSAYVESESGAGVEYEAVFVMDMIGFQAGEARRMTIVQDDETSVIAEAVTGAVENYSLGLTVDIVANESIVYSDHAPFWDAGHPSVLIIEQANPTSMTPVNPFYHSEFDTSDKLSSTQMEDIAAALLGAVLDLTAKGEDSYSGTHSLLAVTAVLVVAVVAMGLVIRRRRGE